MKYKVGDKIRIIRATSGCYDAEGKIGIITNKHSIHGLYDNDDGFNVDCGCGDVWRIGYESECELLDELTAEEAIKIQAEMCSSMSSCVNCPIYKEKDGYRCESFKAENPEKVVEILKRWKSDHEKKIETKSVNIIRVMKEESAATTCIYTCEVYEDKDDVIEKMDELVDEYSTKYGGKIYATCERIRRVKS